MANTPPLAQAVHEQQLFLGSWTVSALVDDDGHLEVFVRHADGTEIYDCDADIGELTEPGFRFTTAGIEAVHAADGAAPTFAGPDARTTVKSEDS